MALGSFARPGVMCHCAACGKIMADPAAAVTSAVNAAHATVKRTRCFLVHDQFKGSQV
jgi:hypothetical protein